MRVRSLFVAAKRRLAVSVYQPDTRKQKRYSDSREDWIRQHVQLRHLHERRRLSDLFQHNTTTHPGSVSSRPHYSTPFVRLTQV